MLELEKIEIKNYKSIDNITLEVKKHGESYATMLVGVNESGKSNIIEAISFIDAEASAKPRGEKRSKVENRNKPDGNRHTAILFHLGDGGITDLCNKNINKREPGLEIYFEILKIEKAVSWSKEDKSFYEEINLEIKFLDSYLIIYYNEDQQNYRIKHKDEQRDTQAGVKDYIIQFFDTYMSMIRTAIMTHMPRVTVWKPDNAHLVSSVNLHEFIQDINSNIPLKYIFAICGYDNAEDINTEINKIFESHADRRTLAKNLTSGSTKYINNIWNHAVKIDIEIDSGGQCNIHIQDKGRENSFFEIQERSAGFQHFMSLILSLSVPANKLESSNKIILIDEPENSLHPSAIRDFAKELIEIGKSNYLFVSTHSPFIIDQDNYKRNIIITKDEFGHTEMQPIKNYGDVYSDKVLMGAFGINAFRDLLPENRVLVEGFSDKAILDEVLDTMGYKDILIMNGNGDNIRVAAAFFNDNHARVLVLTDNDQPGKQSRDAVRNIRGIFNENNVFTIQDLVPSVGDHHTIEDLLPRQYLIDTFQKFCESINITEEFSLQPDTASFLHQAARHLKDKIVDSQGNKIDDRKVRNKELKNVLKRLKVKLSEGFPPAQADIAGGDEYKPLRELAEAINRKLDEEKNGIKDRLIVI